ncbi:VIT1/CCC1 transporter family protein [Desulfopila inferna]|uniref:VIT1/CCC1 transporter family protein n=1 Tax=Desulfopila inferna TaxID=468528 RepID=UPI001965CB48|nr:VIT1/CCC1 transporter family protein [Desulfopila inferna]MBM9606109.1 VIT1/CCC1 transporter family protein [Desulfopila inferna]
MRIQNVSVFSAQSEWRQFDSTRLYNSQNQLIAKTEENGDREKPIKKPKIKNKTAQLYIKDMVYGATDGIVTTFAVIASIEGAKLGTFAVLAVGFASLLADGLSMAASNYLAGRSEQAVVESNLHPKKDKVEERPQISAFFTFIAFILIGAIPLVPYVLPVSRPTILFPLSITLAIFSLFLVGGLRTRVTGSNFITAGMEMMLIGRGAAAVAYFIGVFIKSFYG